MRRGAVFGCLRSASSLSTRACSTRCLFANRRMAETPAEGSGLPGLIGRAARSARMRSGSFVARGLGASRALPLPLWLASSLHPAAGLARRLTAGTPVKIKLQALPSVTGATTRRAPGSWHRRTSARPSRPCRPGSHSAAGTRAVDKLRGSSDQPWGCTPSPPHSGRGSG